MVSIRDVADELEGGFDWRCFYDRAADGFVYVTVDELSVAEESEDGADPTELAQSLPGAPLENLDVALRIVNAPADAYVPLPDEYDVHMHSIMEDFVQTLPESEMSRRLWNDLHRSGAFRRFKDGVHRYDIADAWYRYRDDRLAGIARRWAAENSGNQITWEPFA